MKPVYLKTYTELQLYLDCLDPQKFVQTLALYDGSYIVIIKK